MRLNYILSCLAVALAVSQASKDPERIIHLSKRVVMGLQGFNIGPRRGTTRPTTTVKSPGTEETVIAAESNFETPVATSGTSKVTTATTDATSGTPEIAFGTTLGIPEATSGVTEATATTAEGKSRGQEVTSSTTNAVSLTTGTVSVTTKSTVSKTNGVASQKSKAASRTTEVSSEAMEELSRPTSEKTRRMTVTVKSRPTWIGYSSGWTHFQPKWSSYYRLTSARTRPSNSISRTMTVTYKPTFISNRPNGANDVRYNIITDKAKLRRSATDAASMSKESRTVSSDTTTDAAEMSTVSESSVAAGGSEVEPSTDTSTVKTKISKEDKFIDYIDKLGTVVAKSSLIQGADSMMDMKGKHINDASLKPIIAEAVPIEAAVVEPDDELITPRILELHRIPKKMQLFEPKVIPADEPSFTVGKSTGFIGVHSVTDKRLIRALDTREFLDLLRRETVNTTNEQSIQTPTSTEHGSLPAAPLMPLIPAVEEESTENTPISSQPTRLHSPPVKARTRPSSSDDKDLKSYADQLSEIASEVESDPAGRIYNSVNAKNKNIKAPIKPIVAATLPIKAAVVASEGDDKIAILELKGIPKRIRH